MLRESPVNMRAKAKLILATDDKEVQAEDLTGGEIKVMDRFGNPVLPRAWFLVPIAAIDAVVDKIRDGTITRSANDPATAELVEREDHQCLMEDAANGKER